MPLGERGAEAVCLCAGTWAGLLGPAKLYAVADPPAVPAPGPDQELSLILQLQLYWICFAFLGFAAISSPLLDSGVCLCFTLLNFLRPRILVLDLLATFRLVPTPPG